MARRIREMDWASTPLGPVSEWPQSLKSAVDLCLGSAFESFVSWGPELIQFYNDAALKIVGAKHPRALGVPARESWADVWDLMRPLVDHVLQTGESYRGEDTSVGTDPGSPQAPAYFTFSYSPARDESGAVAGIFVTAIETTQQRRAQDALRETQVQEAFLLRLSDALRDLEDSSEIKSTACTLLGEHLRVDRCLYVDVEGDSFSAPTCYAKGVSPLPARSHPVSALGPLFLAAYQRDEMLVVNDLATDDRFTEEARDWYRGMQVAAFTGVLLVKNGRWVGAFGVHSATPRIWSEAETQLTAAGRTGCGPRDSGRGRRSPCARARHGNHFSFSSAIGCARFPTLRRFCAPLPDCLANTPGRPW